MRNLRTRILVGAVAASTLAGGAIGATVFSAGASSAAKSTTSTTQAAPPGGTGAGAPARPPNGRFRPIETQAHEAAESKEREAQEDAGKFPTVP